jgi:hypothetical protein
MSATTVKLLQTASEIVGGDKALAHRLGIAERVLARLLADEIELPDPLLLRAVDIIFAQQKSELLLVQSATRAAPQRPVSD